MKILRKLRNFSFKKNLHTTERFFVLPFKQISVREGLNFLKSKILSNKTSIILVAIVALGIFVIPQSANAALWDWLNPFKWGPAIVNYLLGIGFSLTAAVFGFFVMIINVLLTATAFFAKMFTELSIMLSFNFPYTEMINVDGNTTAVGSAWTVMRDLANMGLVVVLVMIGVGTMLNLNQGRLKSRLPWFFIVALLINFTPLITGVVIDFSNIIANVFWKSAQNFSSAYMGANPLSSINLDAGIIFNVLTDGVTGKFDILKYMSVMMMFMLSIVMNVIMIFVFILLAGLFMGRTLALILLVIFSPIAFLALILPSTKKHFDKWWSNFLQWAIIVIPMIFFLWLSGIFSNNVNDICNIEGVSDQLNIEGDLGKVLNPDTDKIFIESKEDLGDFNNYACGMLNMFLATGTIIIGIGVSLKSSATGATIITKRAKTIKDKTIKWASESTKDAIGKKGRDIGAKWLSEKGQYLAQSRLGKNKYAGAPLRALGSGMQQAMLKWRQEYKSYEAKNKGKDPDMIKGDLYGKDDRAQAAFVFMAKNHPNTLKKQIGEDDELKERLDFAVKRSAIRGDDSMKEVEKLLPHEVARARARKMVGNKKVITSDDYNKEVEKIMPKISSRDVPNLSDASLQSEEIVSALEKQGKLTRESLNKLAQNAGRVGMLNETILKNYKKEISAMSNSQRRKIFEGKDVVNEILSGGNVRKMMDLFVKYKKKTGRDTSYNQNIKANPGLAAIYNITKSGQKSVQDLEKEMEDLTESGQTSVEDLKKEIKGLQEKT